MREFELLGYVEYFHDKLKNKPVGSRTLKELPEGRKLSSYGNIDVVFPKGTILRLRKSVSEYEWKSQGQTLVSTILPINGKLISKK